MYCIVDALWHFLGTTPHSGWEIADHNSWHDIAFLCHKNECNQRRHSSFPRHRWLQIVNWYCEPEIGRIRYEIWYWNDTQTIDVYLHHYKTKVGLLQYLRKARVHIDGSVAELLCLGFATPLYSFTLLLKELILYFCCCNDNMLWTLILDFQTDKLTLRFWPHIW